MLLGCLMCVCVCVVCVSMCVYAQGGFKSSLVWIPVIVVCANTQTICMSKCMVCHDRSFIIYLFIYFWVVSWVCITCIGLWAVTFGKTAQRLICPCKWKQNILQLIHFDFLREIHWQGRRKKERELKCPSLSIPVCLSLWTALRQSSWNRLPIIEYLDWFASKSHSCRGNVNSGWNKQASNEIRVHKSSDSIQGSWLMMHVIFLLFG